LASQEKSRTQPKGRNTTKTGHTNHQFPEKEISLADLPISSDSLCIDRKLKNPKNSNRNFEKNSKKREEEKKETCPLILPRVLLPSLSAGQIYITCWIWASPEQLLNQLR
jgi:hypothetical protein